MEGVLERITYVADKDAWSVVQVSIPQRAEPITVVGNLLGVQPGASLRFTGKWVQSRKYGPQFKVSTYEMVRPVTLTGIEKYLGSGLIRGIGPEMAARIVTCFGVDTLSIIDDTPEKLLDVQGIGPKRVEQIQAAWHEQRALREVMLFLQTYGVTPSFANRIYKRYGDNAISLIQANPYRLAIDIHGIGFKSADTIAQRLGVPTNSPQRAEAGILHYLAESAGDGHVCIPREAMLRDVESLLGVDRLPVEEALATLITERKVVSDPPFRGTDDDDAIYLGAHHTAELGVAMMLKACIATPVDPIAIDVERAITWFESKSELTLAEEQREAIRRAPTEKVLVITGGPGTGKTTLLRAILLILKAKGRRILLAAPTGRAAKRMEEATGHPAQTIHRLLEFNPSSRTFEKNGDKRLDADILVVDEASMLDTTLAYHLMRALNRTTQLILVGDVNQLPSVGPGNVLREIIQSGVATVVRLKEIFRQEASSLIITNAHLINNGLLPHMPDRERASDFYFIERDEPQALLSTLKELVGRHIPRRFSVDPIDGTQVLIPMHRGPLGTSAVNLELQSLLNPTGTPIPHGARSFRVGDKVMQTRNNYDLGVFNGDIGRIEDFNRRDGTVDVRFEGVGATVTYEIGALDELMLAYATTVHKSQGSEYPCVVLVLHTSHYTLLQRNLLYTAVTRGRKAVIIVGNTRALEIAVKNGEARVRQTRLAAHLNAD